MSYREIPKDKILRFPSTAGFKGWRAFFSDESRTHPAKANLHLLKWIIKKYTDKQDIILDPMAGTGSTIILAALEERNGIAIEYEPQFCKMIEDNINLTLKQKTLRKKGTMFCFRGDAKELCDTLEELDAIITSPPYGNRLSDVAIHDGDPARIGYRQAVDTILTSPPFEDSVPAYDERWLEEHWNDKSKSPKHKTMRFGKSMKGYPRADTIITSPPFNERTPRIEPQGGKSLWKTLDTEIETVKAGYNSSENIGNLKGISYLEAMFKVYRECWKSLKKDGKMILITKNFIREKTIVRLDEDTIGLCERAGFNLIDRWYLELPTKSFWKILYHKNYPSVPEVKYEDILIFEKNQSSLRKAKTNIEDSPTDYSIENAMEVRTANG